MQMKKLVELKKLMPMQDMVVSCIKLFGEVKASAVLKKIYKGKELAQALAILQSKENEITFEECKEEKVAFDELEGMNEVEINDKGDEVMAKKQTKAVKIQELEDALDMHIDNDGIDALEDTRVVNSDHGVDNSEDNLEWWLMHAKNSEMKPVPFRDVINKFEKGTYAGTVRNVYPYFKFGQRRFVINIALEPIYSKAEHRGYVFESCPVFLGFQQYESICNELGWDFDDMQSVKGNPVNICITEYDEEKGSRSYFIQGKKK